MNMDDITHPKKRKRPAMPLDDALNATLMTAESLITPMPVATAAVMNPPVPMIPTPTAVGHMPVVSATADVPIPVPSPAMIKKMQQQVVKRRKLNDGTGYKDEDKTGWNAAGGEIKKGKFSVKENQILMNAIDEYCKTHNIPKQSLAEQDLRSANIRGCWTELATCLPNRNSHSIYGHAIRMIHQGNHKGKWSEEETEKLTVLVGLHGNKWKFIGEQLGRYWLSVRDKWRGIKNKNYKKGHWSPEEEEKLIELVRAHHSHEHNMGPGERRAPKRKIFWEKIASIFTTRNVTQLRTKWHMTLHKEVLKKEMAEEDNLPGSMSGYNRLQDRDTLLVKSIYDSGATDESEIPWPDLPLKCTTYTARQHWKQMVKRVPDASAMTFEQLVEYLHNTHCSDSNLIGSAEVGVATLLGRDMHAAALAGNQMHTAALAGNQMHAAAIASSQIHAAAMANNQMHAAAMANNQMHAAALASNQIRAPLPVPAAAPVAAPALPTPTPVPSALAAVPTPVPASMPTATLPPSI